MRTIAIPQLYCGASGKKGAYNRQEVGLARAFAALGCRAVVLYPDPDAAPEAVTSEDLEPNVRIYYVPARKAGVSAFYRTWQPLLNEHVDAVHVMGDNALGVPGLYRFCRDHDIFFYTASNGSRRITICTGQCIHGHTLFRQRPRLCHQIFYTSGDAICA